MNAIETIYPVCDKHDCEYFMVMLIHHGVKYASGTLCQLQCVLCKHRFNHDFYIQKEDDETNTV